jgi:hypothetical protein
MASPLKMHGLFQALDLVGLKERVDAPEVQDDAVAQPVAGDYALFRVILPESGSHASLAGYLVKLHVLRQYLTHCRFVSFRWRHTARGGMTPKSYNLYRSRLALARAPSALGLGLTLFAGDHPRGLSGQIL